MKRWNGLTKEQKRVAVDVSLDLLIRGLVEFKCGTGDPGLDNIVKEILQVSYNNGLAYNQILMECGGRLRQMCEETAKRAYYRKHSDQVITGVI